MRRIEHPPEPELLTLLFAVDSSRKWSSGGAKDVHEAMQLALWLAQNGMCAYCERPIIADVCLRSEKCPCEKCEPNHATHTNSAPQSKKPSIEHFHPRSPTIKAGSNCVSVGDYAWKNLLLVCGDQETCDGPQAKAGKCLCGQIVSPCRISMGAIYLTINPANGAPLPHPSLSNQERDRMKKTIKELKLDNPALNGSRAQIIKLVDVHAGSTDEHGNPIDALDRKSSDQIRWELRASGFRSTIEYRLANPNEN